jgi:hypothetical protein
MSASDGDARAELEELRQAVLDDWIVVTTRTVGVIEAMQATLSWRVTKPLRLAKRFQLAAQSDGLGVAIDLAAVAVARRLGRG